MPARVVYDQATRIQDYINTFGNDLYYCLTSSPKRLLDSSILNPTPTNRYYEEQYQWSLGDEDEDDGVSYIPHEEAPTFDEYGIYRHFDEGNLIRDEYWD